MSSMLLRTAALPANTFFKTTPPTPAAYPTLAPKKAIPTGDGVLPIEVANENPFSFGKFTFWATGTATSTFSVKIVAWQKNDAGEFWPHTLADILCTLSTTTRAISADLCVGTIVVNAALVEQNYIIEPSDNGIQTIKLDLSGYQFVQLVPGTKTGTVTAVNGAMSGF